MNSESAELLGATIDPIGRRFMLSVEKSGVSQSIGHVVLILRPSGLEVEHQNFKDGAMVAHIEEIGYSNLGQDQEKIQSIYSTENLNGSFVTIDPRNYIGHKDCRIVLYDPGKKIVDSKFIKAGERYTFENDGPSIYFKFQIREKAGDKYLPSTHYLTAVEDLQKGWVSEELIKQENGLQFTERKNVILAPIYRPPGVGKQGPDGIIFASAAGEEIPEAMRFRMGSQPYLLAAKGSAAKRLDREVIYGGIPNPSYGHFLTEGVARLWFAKLHPEIPVVWSGTTQELTALQLQILSALEIKNEHIFLDSPTEFSSVIFPFPGLSLGDYCLPEYAAVIGGIPAEAVVPGKKLYLSRSRLEHTRGSVGIEASLENCLERFGFTIFHPELFSLAEQAREISSAEIVLGIEGSALHTLLLIKPGLRTRFFAIGRHRFGEGIFEHIKQAKDLDYRTLLLTRSNKRVAAAEEFEIDFELFEKLLIDTEGLEKCTDLLQRVSAAPLQVQVGYAELVARSKARLSHGEQEYLRAIQKIHQSKSREGIDELWAKFPNISVNKMTAKPDGFVFSSAES